MDGEAQTLLKKLREEKIPAKLPADSIKRFSVEWTGKDGIDEDHHKVCVFVSTTSVWGECLLHVIDLL